MQNPIRRNRNIGKTQGGRIQNGRAYEKWSRNKFLSDSYAKLSDSDEIWQVYQQNPSRNYFHPNQSYEYIEVLNQLPDNLTQYVKAILLPRISKSDVNKGVDAKKRFNCILINPFPISMEMVWKSKPVKATFQHYEPWCNFWKPKNEQWILQWNLAQLKRYYLYHLFLHELGHINQPCYHSRRKREEFAENFALEWARKLGQL